MSRIFALSILLLLSAVFGFSLTVASKLPKVGFSTLKLIKSGADRRETQDAYELPPRDI